MFLVKALKFLPFDKDLAVRPVTLQPQYPCMLTKEMVINALKTIYDPEIPVNIYDLGLIYHILIKEDDHVHIIMTLTTATCPAAAFMPEEVKTVLLETGKIKSATVEVVYSPKWTRELMSEDARQQLGFD